MVTIQSGYNFECNECSKSSFDLINAKGISVSRSMFNDKVYLVAGVRDGAVLNLETTDLPGTLDTMARWMGR